jgi:energy-coupling factor transport system permease protein
MLKDITLGQYFETGSSLHALDARVKFILSIALICMSFIAEGVLSYSVLILAILLFMILSKVPVRMYLKSFKPMLFLLMFTAALNLFLTPTGEVLWSWQFLTITTGGVELCIYMALRLFLLIVITSLLTYTTSPLQLTRAIEYILSPLKIFKFPSHEIAMMMTIALRFVPTLIGETEKIIMAQKARGADFESGNFIRRAKAMIPILIPLFISAFNRADDLAIAMDARCYMGGTGRTSLHIPKISYRDIIAIIIIALVSALVICL